MFNFDDIENYSSSDDDSIQAKPSKVSGDRITLQEIKKKVGRPSKQENEEKERKKLEKQNKKQKMKEILDEYKILKQQEEARKITSKVDRSLPPVDRFESVIEEELKNIISNIPSDQKFLGRCLRKMSNQMIGPMETDLPIPVPVPVPPPPVPAPATSHQPTLSESEPEMIIVKKRKPKKAKIVYAESTTETEAEVKPKRGRKKEMSEREQTEHIQNMTMPSISFF
jgi:hypothetical protein